MAIRSMTGYGRARAERDGWSASAEFRSINYRGLDIRVGIPQGLASLEPAIRQQVKACCARGRVDCRIQVEAPQQAALATSAIESATTLYETLSRVRNQLRIAEPVTMTDLLSAGLDVLSPPEQLDLEPVGDWVLSISERALTSMVEARETEGAELGQELRGRLESVRAHLDRVERLAGEAATRYRERLSGRLEDLLAQLGSTSGVDQDRLLQELAIYVDKSDITEETVRARSHSEALLTVLNEDSPNPRAVGKRIDFFLQELFREANTMASKSGIAELTEEVVALKAEVERLREQANNIE